MRRLTILLAALGALLLVPAAQAFANGNAIIEIEGTGKGKLVAGEFLQGNPPVNCSYASPGPATGTCNTELSAEFGLEGIFVEAIPAAGSELAGWEFEGAGASSLCSGTEKQCFGYWEEGQPGAGGDIHITAYFNLEPVKFPLTIEKTGSGGSVVVKCSDNGSAFGGCKSEYGESHIIKISPLVGSSDKFEGWTGCDSTSGQDCTVTMTGARTVSIKVSQIPKYVLTVKKIGNGEGTVKSTSVAGINCGSECSEKYFEGTEVTLTQKAAEGSEFTGWGGACTGSGGCKVTMSEAKEVTAKFSLPAPPGPTNLRTLTITKNANGPGGTGSVSSKPKGIKCGATCSSAVAAMYKSTPVELTAKPATGSAFVKWENAKEGGSCDGSTNPVCVAPMSEDESLEAVFSGTSKTITPAEALTVSKGESTGKGTVKGPGLGCEAECTSTVVLIQGPITEPKAKPGKIVLLKQAPAFGSKFVGWTGCESEPEGNCQVAMETAKEVVAEYEALPSKVLTVNKSYGSGNGSVSSKPKGIACGTTCTQSVAQMPEGAAVELVAKPTTGTFVKWEGGDCAGSTNPVCIVTMNADETTKAVFSDPGKAIAEAKTLTLNKAGSGLGTVKASGIKCEVLCSSQSALYQGPLTEPKAKPGKTVILKATSAPGSKAVEWTGCDSNPSPSECAVEMDEAHSVTATFDELE